MQICIARLQKFSALTAENKNVSSFAAKVQTVQFDIRSSGGRLFHTRGPATAKFLAPMAIRVHGTYRVQRWRRGVVVSGVRCMNEVNPRRARLLPEWVTVFGQGYHFGM